MTNETKRADQALDFAARILAVTHSTMQAMGMPPGVTTTFLAVQASQSGISDEDFGAVCTKAYGYALEFEAAAITNGVVSG